MMEGKIKLKACTCQGNLKEQAGCEAGMTFIFFLECQLKSRGGGWLNRFTG